MSRAAACHAPVPLHRRTASRCWSDRRRGFEQSCCVLMLSQSIWMECFSTTRWLLMRLRCADLATCIIDVTERFVCSGWGGALLYALYRFRSEERSCLWVWGVKLHLRHKQTDRDTSVCLFVCVLDGVDTNSLPFFFIPMSVSIFDFYYDQRGLLRTGGLDDIILVGPSAISDTLRFPLLVSFTCYVVLDINHSNVQLTR